MKPGKTRINSGFLIIPRRLNNEWRWWQRATWLEECQDIVAYTPEGYFCYCAWVMTKWVD